MSLHKLAPRHIVDSLFPELQVHVAIPAQFLHWKPTAFMEELPTPLSCPTKSGSHNYLKNTSKTIASIEMQHADQKRIQTKCFGKKI